MVPAGGHLSYWDSASATTARMEVQNHWGPVDHDQQVIGNLQERLSNPHACITMNDIAVLRSCAFVVFLLSGGFRRGTQLAGACGSNDARRIRDCSLGLFVPRMGQARRSRSKNLTLQPAEVDGGFDESLLMRRLTVFACYCYQVDLRQLEQMAVNHVAQYYTPAAASSNHDGNTPAGKSASPLRAAGTDRIILQMWSVSFAAASQSCLSIVPGFHHHALRLFRSLLPAALSVLIAVDHPN